MKDTKRDYRMTLIFPIERRGLFTDKLAENRRWCSHSFNTLLRGDVIEATRRITAYDRGRAVYRAVQYYWMRLDGVLGPAWQVLTVDDPYKEVVFTPDFHCPDRKNNYLPPDVRARVLAESNGFLLPGKNMGSRHHAPNALRLAKRRRKLPFRLKPHIYTDANQTFFYRMNVQARSTKSQDSFVKRKVRLVRLHAKSIKEAYSEVLESGLFAEHIKKSKRHVRSRFAMFKGVGPKNSAVGLFKNSIEVKTLL